MDNVKRTLDYLSHFGQVSYTPGRFEGDSIDFACLEIITSEKIAAGLEREIRAQLTSEKGAKACLVLIGVKELSNNQIKYLAEIIPFAFVPRHKSREATEDTLNKLPHIIKNYRMKH